MAGIWMAVDVGGTFVDVVAANPATGEVKVAKLPNIGASQAEQVAQTLRRLEGELGGGAGIETLIIGTTVVTNALLEGDLARTALVSTAGFKDTLAIGRMHRPSSYDLAARRPRPLVDDDLSFEVDERLDVHGAILRPLDEQSLEDVAEQLARADVEAVAVSLLFSYANPAHEQHVADLLRSRLGVPVCASADVLPVFREYERTSTAVVNAATMPVIDRFFDGLGGFAQGAAERVYVMASEGGCLTIAEARRRPAATVLSGPVGGVVGAAEAARRHGFDDVLTLDVGGTSADVALIREGAPPYTADRAVGGYAVALPSIEVHTIGAGGGSIAHVDETGLLRVGPESARADPGPICYGRGGDRVTVTDCYLALGHLGEATMLGGDFEVDRQAAVEGIERHLASRLGISWVRAAEGVLEVVTANIVGALRKISVERGYDPRDAVLVPFGGAGPLQALDVARSLRIRRGLIPGLPGVFSARGMLSCDIRYPGYRTWFSDWTGDVAALADAFGELEREVAGRAEADGLPVGEARVERAVDLRYQGQSYTLTVPLGDGQPDPDAVESAFHGEHERWYGYAKPGAALELVNLRVTLVWPQAVDEGRDGSAVAAAAPSESGPVASREVWTGDGEPLRCPVYQRDRLAAGETVEGPAIVEQYDSTIVLRAGDRLTVTEHLDALVDIAIPQEER
jgi:N-methylhydantoinase A